jgi:hypothetical protein
MCCPLVWCLEKTLQLFLGKIEKAGRATVFSVMASLNTHRFDLTIAYDVFSICVYCYNKNKKKIKKNWENLQDFISLGLLDIACIFA